MRYETERTRRRGQPDSKTDTLARGLGMFSIGLGLAEVFAARSLTRFLGMEGHETLIRAYGLREIANGRRNPRVAGSDPLDVGPRRR